MAAAIFRKILQDKRVESTWIIESAGTWAPKSEPIAPRAKVALSEMSVFVRDHRSRSVTREMLRPFQLILTMEKGHKEALRTEFPEFAHRTFLITEMIDQQYEIHDPIGGPLDDYRGTARELEKILYQGFDKIVRLASLPLTPGAE